MGSNSTEGELQRVMSKWIRQHGFKCQKFVVDGDYCAGSPLIYHCMKACLPGFEETKWEKLRHHYFSKYGKFIKRTLNHKRNCCQSSIKSMIRGTYKHCTGKSV